jgi:RNA polymerase sigma factor (sigma-70 family)
VQAVAEPQVVRDRAVDDAFERLYRSYARDVYRYTLAVLRNPADAEDITQTTFLNAYRAYLRGEEPRRPRHWLIKIAHNACLSRHLRAVRRPQEVPLDETIAALPMAAEDAPKLEELLAALGRLPFNQRAALVMRELEGRSYADIADTLEVSLAAVETLIFRARRALRRDPSLLGVLGSVQLPQSLAGLFGSGGGGAVAGGGVVLASGFLAKAALIVAAGVVAGALGPTVAANVSGHGGRSEAVVARKLVSSTPVRTRALAGIRVLSGPIAVVTRRGRAVAVTEGVPGTRAGVAFVHLGDVHSSTASTASGAQTAAGPNGSAATGAASAPASSPAAVPSNPVTSAVPTTTSATSQLTDAVSSATSSPSVTVSTPVASTTVAAPAPPPVEVPALPVSVPTVPTVPLP